jgi:hypothetical protein
MSIENKSHAFVEEIRLQRSTCCESRVNHAFGLAVKGDIGVRKQGNQTSEKIEELGHMSFALVGVMGQQAQTARC